MVSAKAGDDINLSCSAVAHPEPLVTWSKEVDLSQSQAEIKHLPFFIEWLTSWWCKKR